MMGGCRRRSYPLMDGCHTYYRHRGRGCFACPESAPVPPNSGNDVNGNTNHHDEDRDLNMNEAANVKHH